MHAIRLNKGRKVKTILYTLILSITSLSAMADCKFDRTSNYGEFQVRVYTDGHSCSLQSYQIVVRRAGQVLQTVTKQSEAIKQIWLTDLDNNGLFELLVFSASVEAGKYGELALHEWTGSGFHSHFLPPPAVIQGYRGFDNYRIYQNQIIHEFPIYQQGDKECCPSSGKRQSIYQYQNGNFVQIASNLVNN